MSAMSDETLIGTLIVITVLILATCVPLLAHALRRVRAESLAPAPDFLPVEPVIEAPSTDPERLHFEEAVQRMLTRYPVTMLDRSRLAGEIAHHWQQHLAGIATWAVAFASVEAWVRRQTQINRPLTQRETQTLRDPRPHVAGSARRLQAAVAALPELPTAPSTLPENLRALGDQVLHDCLDEAADALEQAATDRVALAGVRDLIEGRITEPLPGTLAARIHEWANSRALRLVESGICAMLTHPIDCDDINALAATTNPKAA